MCGNSIDINTTKERIFILLVIYISSIVNASIFGNMAVLIQTLDQSSQKYEEIMDIVNEHMRYLKVPN